MASEYWLAWIALYGFGIVFIALCLFVIRRRLYLSLFVGGMGIFWMLVPIPFGDGNAAPLYVVLIFQVALEPDVSYAFSATTAIVGSACITVAVMLLYAFHLGLQKLRPRFQPLSEPSSEKALLSDESQKP